MHILHILKNTTFGSKLSTPKEKSEISSIQKFTVP